MFSTFILNKKGKGCTILFDLRLDHLNSSSIRTNMEDLRVRTHTVHYQLYRSNRMTGMGFTDISADNKPVR